MEHVQNTTEMTLGWQGLIVEPGQVVEVRDGQAEQMRRQTGGKFAPVSMEAAKAHRHRYTEGEDVCNVDDCDHIKRGSSAANGNDDNSGDDPSDPKE